MTELERIERDVASPSKEGLTAFAKWFEEWRADRWDRQIEEDAKAGRLDRFGEKARAAIRS